MDHFKSHLCSFLWLQFWIRLKWVSVHTEGKSKNKWSRDAGQESPRLRKMCFNYSRQVQILWPLLLKSWVWISLVCHFWPLLFKSQIKTEWIYKTINFPKYDQKKLKDFCPMYFRAGILQIPWVKFCKIDDFKNCFRDLLTYVLQGRNPSNFSGQILENWWFQKLLSSTV